MLKVAICDDDAAQCALTRQYCEKLFKELGISGDTVLFLSAEALLSAAQSGFDIIFLDIRFESANGIQTARSIRKFDSNVEIVFMTNYEAYAVEGYSVRAYRYLLKPFSYAQFRSETGSLFEKAEAEFSDSIKIKNNDEVLACRLREISHIETFQNKGVLFHTEQQVIRHTRSLSYWEKQLGGKGFCRCHASYLVNFRYVKKIRRGSLALQDGTVIPISKHRYHAILESFLEYSGGLL